MRILSLFDGMGCGRLALDRAGIEVDAYYASEIDKYAMAVTNYHYPNVVQLGDIREWRNWDIGEIDMILAGSPCQGFSNAGKGLNFDDPRSKLYFEFEKILEYYKPRYWLLENVKMKGEWADIIDDRLGVERVLINSTLVSAQNRERYYWENFGITQPEDKNIYWGDVKENSVNSISFYYTEKSMQWLARHSRKHNKIFRVYSDNEKMQMIEASHYKKYSSQRFFGILDTPTNEQAIAAVRERYINSGKTKQYIEFRHDKKTNAITTVGKDNVVVPFTLKQRVFPDEFFFRYITPLECERLQTVPDNYTLVPWKNRMMSNTQRYKMLGNGWTVDVIAHILSCRDNPQIKQMKMF